MHVREQATSHSALKEPSAHYILLFIPGIQSALGFSINAIWLC
jgi:hypothetical protein